MIFDLISNIPSWIFGDFNQINDFNQSDLTINRAELMRLSFNYLPLALYVRRDKNDKR